jgi:hypothetical protein
MMRGMVSSGYTRGRISPSRAASKKRDGATFPTASHRRREVLSRFSGWPGTRLMRLPRERVVEARLEIGGDFRTLIFVFFLTGFAAKLMTKISSACQSKWPATKVTSCLHDDTGVLSTLQTMNSFIGSSGLRLFH